MEPLENYIYELIYAFKNSNPDKINPLCNEFDYEYDVEKFEQILLYISDNEEKILNSYRKRIESSILKDKIKSFNFVLHSCLNDGRGIDTINIVLNESLSFTIEESEIEIAKSNPEIIIKEKLDYKNQIEEFISSYISSFDYTKGSNQLYLVNKRPYVIAVLIIKYIFQDLNNPISLKSNAYEHLESFYTNEKFQLDSILQYSKYKLIELNDNFELQSVFPVRIFDKLNNKTIYTLGISGNLNSYLLNLKSKFNFNLSIKPSSIFYQNELVTLVHLYEHLEIGKYFDNLLVTKIPLTKLYDNEYNTFWVKTDSKNITFEEMLSDFETYKETIVTRVLHCEYEIENSITYLNHLDHEYIFYSISEFEERQSDSNQKGEIRTRIKTFKIDNAKIPLTEEKNILYDILMEEFKNKDLIREYFNSIDV